MNFSWSKLDKPVFILAPMANITSLPFRSICKDYGADIVFTPMFSANAIIHNPKKTLKQLKFNKAEQPVIVQIFGYDGELIAKAANIIQKEYNPAGIDINMGCPAPKITGNESGSALLRDYDKALKIAQTIRNEYKGQLSVKVRLGWRDKDVLPFILELEKIGIDAISIHGRTAKEGYSGKADWAMIDKIASSVSIPVIGNGDITDWEQAWIHANNKDFTGIMIGRGTLGRPWLFQEIKEKHTITKTPGEIAEIIVKQALLSIDYIEDEERAIRELRKHLGWYLKDFPSAKSIRKRAMLISTLDELKTILTEVSQLQD